MALGVAVGSGPAGLADLFGARDARARRSSSALRLPRVLPRRGRGRGARGRRRGVPDGAAQSARRAVHPRRLRRRGARRDARHRAPASAAARSSRRASVPAAAFAGGGGGHAARLDAGARAGEPAGASILLAGVVVNAIAGAGITVRSRRFARSRQAAVARLLADGVPRRADVAPARVRRRSTSRWGRRSSSSTRRGSTSRRSATSPPRASASTSARSSAASSSPAPPSSAPSSARPGSSASWASSCRRRCAACVGPDLRVLLPASLLAGAATPRRVRPLPCA